LTALFAHLNTRDLRPVFSPRQVSTILPRGDVLILNLGFIKALIGKERAYFIVHGSEDRIAALCKKITIPSAGVSDSDERQPFVLFVLEKILSSQLTHMRADAPDDADPDQQQHMDNTIDEITSILENFIEQIEEIDGTIRRLRESVDDTEEFITLKLNARRTAIIRADLLATITTLILSFLAVIVGLYGTNIRNGFENSPEAFATLKLFLVGFFILSLAIAYLILKKKRLF